MTPDGDDPYVVRSVARALDILDLLGQEHDGATLADLSTALKLPKSSVFRYLATLASRGYVVQDGEGGAYRLGIDLAASHSRRLQVLRDRARPLLERLRDDLGETVNLAVLDGNRIVYVDILESTRAMRLSARVGDRVPVHSSALGKTIAASMPPEEVIDILEAEGMARLTANTITEVGPFLAELELARQRGYAVDDREHEEDGRCVAVAIPGGRIPAAISLSAPAMRFTSDDVADVAEALMTAAGTLAPQRADLA